MDHHRHNEGEIEAREASKITKLKHQEMKDIPMEATIILQVPLRLTITTLGYTSMHQITQLFVTE